VEHQKHYLQRLPGLDKQNFNSQQNLAAYSVNRNQC